MQASESLGLGPSDALSVGLAISAPSAFAPEGRQKGGGRVREEGHMPRVCAEKRLHGM